MLAFAMMAVMSRRAKTTADQKNKTAKASGET